MVLKAPLAHAQAPTHATLRASVRAAVDPSITVTRPTQPKSQDGSTSTRGWFGLQARARTAGDVEAGRFASRPSGIRDRPAPRFGDDRRGPRPRPSGIHRPGVRALDGAGSDRPGRASGPTGSPAGGKSRGQGNSNGVEFHPLNRVPPASLQRQRRPEDSPTFKVAY